MDNILQNREDLMVQISCMEYKLTYLYGFTLLHPTASRYFDSLQMRKKNTSWKAFCGPLHQKCSAKEMSFPGQL